MSQKDVHTGQSNDGLKTQCIYKPSSDTTSQQAHLKGRTSLKASRLTATTQYLNVSYLSPHSLTILIIISLSVFDLSRHLRLKCSTPGATNKSPLTCPCQFWSLPQSNPFCSEVDSTAAQTVARPMFAKKKLYNNIYMINHKHLIYKSPHTPPTNQKNSARSEFLVVSKSSDDVGRFNSFLQRLCKSIHCSHARFG